MKVRCQELIQTDQTDHVLSGYAAPGPTRVYLVRRQWIKVHKSPRKVSEMMPPVSPPPSVSVEPKVVVDAAKLPGQSRTVSYTYKKTHYCCASLKPLFLHRSYTNTDRMTPSLDQG